MEFQASLGKRLQAKDHVKDKSFMESGGFGRGKRRLQAGFDSSGKWGFGEQNDDGLQSKIVNYLIGSGR